MKQPIPDADDDITLEPDDPDAKWWGAHLSFPRIQRPRTRIWFNALKDCDPPETCMTASVRPCVGRSAPSESGIQSICDFITPVIAP